MGYEYTTVDGSRVEVHVATAFATLRGAFRARFGLELGVTDGTRTRGEQEALYQAYLNGGTLAAYPGYSNHEEDGPRGPRALDVHDSGADAGVTRYDNDRSNWLRQNAPDYGFDPAGYGFSQVEPWHIEYTGSLDGPVPGKDSTPALIPSEEDDMDLALKINIGGTYHLATLIPGTFKGLIDGDDPELVKNQIRADDAWTPVTERQLQTLLHAAGVATDCYRRAGSSMEIRHAVTGVWSRGGRWSTSDILEALLGKAQAR